MNSIVPLARDPTYKISEDKKDGQLYYQFEIIQVNNNKIILEFDFEKYKMTPFYGEQLTLF